MPGKRRIPVGGRNIPGLWAAGSKPGGSSKQLKQGADVKQLVRGPNQLRQGQGNVGGGGTTVNSQPVK